MERRRRVLRQIVNAAGGVGVASLLGFMGLSVTSFRVHADSSNADSTVQLGLAIAPVKLNLSGLDQALVGKGSYIVPARPAAAPAQPNTSQPKAKTNCSSAFASPATGPARKRSAPS